MFCSSNWCQNALRFSCAWLRQTHIHTRAHSGIRRLAERKWEWDRYLFCWKTQNVCVCCDLCAEKQKFEILSEEGSTRIAQQNINVRQAKMKTATQTKTQSLTIKKERKTKMITIHWHVYLYVYVWKWLGRFVCNKFSLHGHRFWPRRVECQNAIFSRKKTNEYTNKYAYVYLERHKRQRKLSSEKYIKRGTVNRILCEKKIYVLLVGRYSKCI